MIKTLQRFDDKIAWLIFGALIALCLGVLTSISILSAFHILLVIPVLVFIPQTNFKKWTPSIWALCTLSIIIVASIVFNQSVSVNGYKSISKVKYFIFGYLAIAPLSYYFNKYGTDKKLSILLYLFTFAATIASVTGTIGLFTGVNPLTMNKVATDRNAGLFGMLMNYAHNITLFEIIVLGFIFYRNEVKKYISMNYLYIVFVINLAGLYLTYTRGAWLGFLMAVPFFFYKKAKKVFLIAFVLIILVGIGAYFSAGKIVTERARSNNERISQWEASLKAVEERPILGYGYLNFEKHAIAIKKRYGIGSQTFGGHAHNNFFEMLASTGIVGFICFTFWVVAWFIELQNRDDLAARIGLPFIVAFVMGGMTQSTIALGINLFFIMSCFSLTQLNKQIVKGLEA